MKIVFLDAYTMNPGDLDFTALYQLGDFKKYDRSKLDDIPDEVREAEILIVNKFEINERSLSLMPKVKYICVAATGFNNIDIDAVRKRNILVSNVKGYSTESVAQHVMASILAFSNRVEYYNQRVKEGEWSKKEDFCFYEKTIYPLSSQTIGIIGYGSIGKRVTRLADSFGMRVLVNTRSDISDKTNVVPVSYTHLDVYKRQGIMWCCFRIIHYFRIIILQDLTWMAGIRKPLTTILTVMHLRQEFSEITGILTCLILLPMKPILKWGLDTF